GKGSNRKAGNVRPPLKLPGTLLSLPRVVTDRAARTQQPLLPAREATLERNRRHSHYTRQRDVLRARFPRLELLTAANGSSQRSACTRVPTPPLPYTVSRNRRRRDFQVR
ncbi:unnamed protein product, partial [Ixodes pacificus]